MVRTSEGLQIMVFWTEGLGQMQEIVAMLRDYDQIKCTDSERGMIAIHTFKPAHLNHKEAVTTTGNYYATIKFVAKLIST